MSKEEYAELVFLEGIPPCENKDLNCTDSLSDNGLRTDEWIRTNNGNDTPIPRSFDW